jgi:hypothetical protein
MRSSVIWASLALPFQIRQRSRSTSVTIPALARSCSGVSTGRLPAVFPACSRRRAICRVAGLRYRSPAPSEPDMTIARHPAQASAVGKRSPAARSTRSWFRPTGGFRHPSFSLFSLRCLTSPSVEVPSFITPLRPTGSLHPFELGIPALAALSPPLQRSLRFLRHPLPSPPSPFLTVELPPYGGTDGAYPVV